MTELSRRLTVIFFGELTEDETLGLLKYEKPNIQYCIRNQRLLDESLKIIESLKL